MSINLGLSETQNLFRDREPRAAYMFPEMVSFAGNKKAGVSGDEIFVFQYWPETLDDTYNVEYAQKQIPGASHPLLQWIGGSGRQITFTAQFTAELDTGEARGGLRNAATLHQPLANLMPSDRYTVDIRAALNRLRSYMMADYGTQANGLNSLASPPKKLWLVLEGTLLGGTDDAILVVLRSAPITYESWFPNGHPRIVQVSLTFDQIVQHSAAGQGQSSIKYIGRTPFEQDGANYKFRGTVDRVLGQ